MKSNLIIAIIFAWQLIPVTGFSQECVTCIDSTQNVSIGFLNTFNTAETQQAVLGYNNSANRNNAVAIGTNSTANWSHSYVMGSSSSSNGIHSYAIGSNAIAQSTYSYAIGQSAKSMWSNAFAIGNFTKSDAVGAYVFGLGQSSSAPLVNDVQNSLAIGFNSSIPTFFVGESSDANGTGNVGIATTDPQAKLHVNGDFQVGDLENPQEIRLHGSINAEGDYATALGYGNTASGHSSFASGNSSVAYGPMTTAIGADVLANAPLSAAIGQFLSTYGSNSFAIGRGKNDDLRLTNGTPNSLLIGFNSDKPTFFVSETPYGYQTGKVGIGNVTAPQAKLHIRADEQEDASLRLEATAADKYARIYFGDAHHITAANEQNMSFSLPADRNFIFENGKVGIGTDQPEAKLHVNGDFQVGDLENPQQIRLHGKINVMGEDGTAFGNESTASGNYSFVAGRNSHIHSTPDYPGHYSNIIGSWSKIEHGAHANVIGSFSEATNNFSFVLGTWSKTKGSSSFAIGSHVEAWSGGSFIIGNGQDTTKFINTIPNSLMVGFGSILPTLFVEKAPFSFDNDRTGQIGIGNITAPQAKLHIRADEQEDATLRLEATGSEKHSRIYFTDEHHITAAADDHMHFHTAENKGFVFHEGDIYLSDVESGIIMKSPNGQCWRGVMTDAGSLSFTQTTCPEEASFVPEPPVQQGKLKAYPNPTNGNLIIESVLYGSNTEIAISSMEGKMMLRQMITSERTEVSLKSFTPGTYILQLLTNGQLVESRKVVRQ